MAHLNELTRFICLFHDADRARAAVSALERLGVPREQIELLGDGAESRAANAEALQAVGVPERDVDHLQDGLRAGGVLISFEGPEGQTSAIEKIFHHYTAKKIDETEIETSAASPVAATAPAAAASYAGTPGRNVVPEAVIPVAEEELQVGKRAVDRGGVRVFRRTVEEPVREDVTLHGERVVLEYREVNRPVTDSDLRAGAQQIELVETAEVPVVEKVARVVEEVRVGKVESEHTEVIQDTVRHTEVNVEQVGGTSATGTRVHRE